MHENIVHSPFDETDLNDITTFDSSQKGKSKLKISRNAKADFFNVLKLFYLLLILLILLSTATYTWFSLSRAPKINDMSLYISTASGLEISHELNPEEGMWRQNLIYGEYFEGKTVLRPITYLDEEDTFLAAVVGADGRIEAVNQPLDDERHTNRNDINGYYVKFSFYARTNEAVSVSLCNLGSDESYGTYVVGMPEWNSEEILHNNNGKRMECAIRMGFRITRFDGQGNPLDENPKLIVYEPNSDTHLDYSVGYIPTESISGQENIVPAERLIRQQTTQWQEAMPVQKNVLVYSHGEIIDDAHLFDLDPGQKAQIDVYLWLEGQDVDCRYETDEASQILASIQLWSESRGQSGMDPIE